MKRERTTRVWRLFLLPVLIAPLTGCPEVKDKRPEQRCMKLYEQCQLASGVLGVCDSVTCAEGQPEPCLVCRSQH